MESINPFHPSNMPARIPALKPPLKPPPRYALQRLNELCNAGAKCGRLGIKLGPADVVEGKTLRTMTELERWAVHLGWREGDFWRQAQTDGAEI